MNISTKEIEKQLKPCRYCGNENPQVFHQDYNGDTYVGDEYSIDCDCGICSGWFSAEELIKLWNTPVEYVRNTHVSQQAEIVRQRLHYHFAEVGGGWNIEGMNAPFMKEFLNEVQKLVEYVRKDKSESVSLEIATKRLRACVEFGKYKAWNSVVGEQKAKSIADDFHNGLYGSGCGMWVQANEAIELLESLYADNKHNKH